METKIRKAKLSDMDILHSFQNELGKHERSFDPNIKRKGKIKYYSSDDLKKIIRAKSSYLIILEFNNQPIGCGIAEIVKTQGDWSRYDKKGYIGLIYLDKKYRGKGLGKKLFSELFTWLKKHKLKDIRLHVNVNNTNVVKMNEQFGFKTYLLEMRYYPK